MLVFSQYKKHLFTMIKSILILFAIALTGCVQTSSKIPLLGTSAELETVSVVNIIPNQILTHQIGVTLFQNQTAIQQTQGWNISEEIETKVLETLGMIKTIQVNNLELVPEQMRQLEFKDDQSLAEYEKVLQNIPEILEVARDTGSKKLIVLAPSIIGITMGDVSFFMKGNGLFYTPTGAIIPFSAINLYIINTMSGELMGRHSLIDDGEFLKLENDLPQSVIRQITEAYEKEKQRLEDKEGAGFQMSLGAQIGIECGKLERYSEYNQTNKSIIKNSLKQSIKRSISQLGTIYFASPPIKEGSRTYYSRASHSCEV